MIPNFQTEDEKIKIFYGDSLSVLFEIEDESINTCVTSPPYYGLRDYGIEGQYGLESTPDEYIEVPGRDKFRVKQFQRAGRGIPRIGE